MKKKILIIDTGKEWGGGTNSLLYLVKKLTKTKQYNFYAIFYKNYKKGNSSDIKTELEKLGVSFFLIQPLSLPRYIKILKELLRILFFWNPPFKRFLFFLFDYKFKIKPEFQKICEVINRIKPDLIYLNNQPTTNFAGILASKELNIPAILHCRRNVKHNFWVVRQSNKILKKIICVSQAVKNSLISQGFNPEKCVVVYNGIDPDIANKKFCDIRVKFGIDQDELLFITVGRLVKIKRIQDFIKIIGELIKKFPQTPIKGLIVGDGPEREKMEKLVKKKGLTEKILFVGFQANPLPFIKSADILILTSASEGLPRVVLEAMLLEKPVVSYDIPGIRELIIDGKTGFLVGFKNYKEFIEKLSILVQDSNLREKMGKEGKSRVIKNFTIDEYVEKVNKIFKKVLSQC